MTNIEKFRSLYARLIAALVAVVALASCAEENIETPADAIVDQQTETGFATTGETVSSFTIAGINTQIATDVDARDCTYVIPEGVRLVDGTELKLKPGSVLCLTTGVVYDNLELINLVGTEEAPITVATSTK